MKRNVLAVAALLGTVVLVACQPAAPPPPPAPSGSSDLHAIISEVFVPYCAGVVAIADCIAGRESGWNPNATNGQYRGLFQLGANYNATIAFYGGNVFDPRTNAQVARDSYVQRGNFSAFSPAGSCGG